MSENQDIVELKEDLSSSPLYSADLAPVPKSQRTWNTWHLAALWVGMAVCIPTYLLASYMMRSGLNWIESLLIIGFANVIITVPMVLNGHAGVKYGIPFPVIGRAAFGTKGIHIASLLRGIVACGWFGVQTWIGGLAIYAIFNALTGETASLELTVGKFASFITFWFINMYFIWKGTESIKWLEEYSAPILIALGIALIGWGVYETKDFGLVLDKSSQLGLKTAQIVEKDSRYFLELNPLREDKTNTSRATHFKIFYGEETGLENWLPIESSAEIPLIQNTDVSIKLMKKLGERSVYSSIIKAEMKPLSISVGDKIWTYILWLTAMVGFWATMSISISDITRYADSQKSQTAGQYIGLPGTMMLYSFVGIFVTSASVLIFEDILISDDAPWDPVTLLSRFENPIVVIVTQIFMLIATLSTNIAANVIAPSNAFSNLNPRKINFKTGGFITGLIGILICPWWLMNEISGILIFISGLLGPVLGILISDYFLVRKKTLNLKALFSEHGEYSYSSGYNPASLIALALGVLTALIGYWIKELEFLYTLSWFSGFTVSFFAYYFLMGNSLKSKI